MDANAFTESVHRNDKGSTHPVNRVVFREFRNGTAIDKTTRESRFRPSWCCRLCHILGPAFVVVNVQAI